MFKYQYFIHFLLLFSPIVGAEIVGLERSIDEVHSLEQVCTRSSAVMTKRAALISTLAARFEEHFYSRGIGIEEVPENFHCDTWNECGDFKNIFKEFLSRMNDEEQCEAIQLAYLHAVSRIVTMKPTLEPENLWKSFYERAEMLPPDVIDDRDRAAWEFRYFYHMEASEIPKECGHFVLLAHQRASFIFSNEYPIRKPIGNMSGACGRPYNSHYDDSNIDPSEWIFVEDSLKLITGEWKLDIPLNSSLY